MTTRRSRRRAAAVAAALAALLTMAGCGGPKARYAGVTSTVATRPAAAEGLDAVREFRSTRGYRATPAPARLEIGRIGVSTGLQRLGRARDGTVEVPSEWGVAGWYAGGTRPGDPGSAVILGHVDSKSGPAVFYRLRELRPGDLVEVVQAGGTRVRFAVERTEQVDKDRFPTADVYYPTLTPMLRLVTCGGSFDPTTGHYRSNVIVYATLRR
jgi:Sortase domain